MIISCWIPLRMKNFLCRLVDKIKIHILYLITFFRISCHLREDVGKYGRARQGRDNNTIQLAVSFILSTQKSRPNVSQSAEFCLSLAFWEGVGEAERRFIETCTYVEQHQNITNITYPLLLARFLLRRLSFPLYMSRTIPTPFLQIIFSSIFPSFIFIHIPLFLSIPLSPWYAYLVYVGS